MKALAGILVIVTMLCCAAVGHAHPPQTKPNTGSISGQVTVEGKPAAGVVVVLNQSDTGAIPRPRVSGPNVKPFAKSVTDEEGRFTFTGLAASSYFITAASATLVSASDSMDWRQGKRVHLAAGETIDDVSIPLIRGGVITGRVTDAEGRPLIGERVALYQIDERNQSRPIYFPNRLMFEIDDRGIYRLYGLRPGRYRVSVGVEIRGDMERVGFGSSFFERTFHPDQTDESKATVIEITPGSEQTSIDIRVGKRAEAFSVSGRAVYADTGQPVEGAMCGYGTLSPDGKYFASSTFGYRTDKTGVFHLQGVLPGKYGAFSMIEGRTEYYSEAVPFEITGADITGIEIKFHRGASISGMVIVEGAGDPEILSKLTQMQISLHSDDDLRAPVSNSAKIAPDGSFHIGGVKPGLIKLAAYSEVGFQHIRVERDGIDQTGGIEVTAGAAISGVRVVVGYGTGRIRGQIKFESGRMPEGVQLSVFISRARDNALPQQFSPHVQVDQRGRFELSGLLPGDYTIAVRSYAVSQIVKVANDTDTEVTLVIPRDKEKERDR